MSKLPAAHSSCCLCGREFTPSSHRWTCLDEGATDVSSEHTRLDYCADCWESKPAPESDAQWRSVVLRSRARGLSRDEEVRKVEEMVSGLELPEESRDYLLGLFLLKRKLARLEKVVESPEGPALWQLKVRGQKALFEISDLGDRLPSIHVE